MSELIDKEGAARYLRVSLSTLERLMRTGLPYIKGGRGQTGSVRFAPEDLADYVQQRRVVARAADSGEGRQ